MSRTYRRKNTKVPKWFITELKYEKGYVKEIPYTGKKLKRAIAKYYSDCGYGLGWMTASTPKWFRQERNRLYRVKMKREVKRILREEDFENYSFDPFKKDTKYLWW